MKSHLRFIARQLRVRQGLRTEDIYELVSPANKHGAEAGGKDNGIHPFMLAGVHGDEAAFDTGL